jgi:hypothetical protein
MNYINKILMIAIKCGLYIAFWFVLNINASAAEKIDWQGGGAKTGNRLAVLDFSSEGISTPLRDLLTKQFRQNLKKLNIYEVLDASMTNKVEIFYPGESLYGECKSKGCILELGKLLKVNYVVAGTIIEKEKEYFVKGKMYSIDLEQEVQGFSIDNVSEIDSIRLEMKKLSYNVSGLEVPDTLTIEASSETLSYLNTQKEKQKAPWLRLPKIPKKVKSLMYSTFVPGAGQVYSKRSYTGMGFFGTEIIIGGLALLAHSNYQKSWGGFEEKYTNYQNENDPGKLIELRPDIIRYASDTKKHNNFLKGLRVVGASIWGINMLHAYIVAPDEIFVNSGNLGSFAESESKPRMTTWDVLSGFGLRGSIVRPIFKGNSLSAYSPYTDGGFLIHTPIGLYFGSVFTSLTYEVSNYSFTSSSFDNEYEGSSSTLALNFDLTKKISFGGNSLKKYTFLGRSTYDDGKGYVIGGDLVYGISTFPLSFALSSRANLVNTSSLGSTMWVSLGVNVGIQIP